MSDFDPYAYVATDNSDSSSFDPYAYAATSKDTPAPVSVANKQQAGYNQMLGPPGAIEQALHSAISSAGQNIGATSHVIGNLFQGKIGSIADADIAAQQYKASHPAYQPESEGGRTAAAVMGSNLNPLNWPGVALKAAGKGITGGLDAVGVPSQYSTVVGPLAEAGGNVALGAYGAIKGLGLGAGEAPEAVSAAPGTQTKGEPLSASGASRAPYSAVGEEPLAPAAQQIVDQTKAAATQQGTPINEGALARHAEAKSLPTPVQLTAGQATQDPGQISWEMNNRGAIPDLAARYNSQNGALVQNMNQFSSNAGGALSVLDNEQHGANLINAYEAHDAAVSADISSKYKALTDANGGQFPVDGSTLVSQIKGALQQKLKSGYISPGLKSALDEFDGENARPMTFEDYETLRTDAAADMRGGGNTAAAANIVRQQLENLPLSGATADLKPLADAARSAAKARFSAIEDDPAYKAVVNGSADSRTFANRYVVNASAEDLKSLKGNLSDQPNVDQHLGGIATNWLRDKAAIDPNGNGNFAANSFNKGYQYLRQNGKINLLMDQPTADGLRTLGNVARYTTAQPKGSFVNNSNTLTGALAEGAASTAEHAANYAAHGVPVGTAARWIWNRGTRARQASEALSPLAGVGDTSKLSDLLQQPAAGAK